MSPYMVLAFTIGIFTGWLIHKKQSSDQLYRLRRRAQRYRLAIENNKLLEQRQNDSTVSRLNVINSPLETVEQFSENDLTLTFNESEALVQVQQELQEQIRHDDVKKLRKRVIAQERGKAHALLEMHKTRIHELQTTLSQQKSRLRAMATNIETLKAANGQAQKDKSLAAHRLKFASKLQSNLSKQSKEIQILVNKVEVFEEDRAEKLALIAQLRNQLNILARQLDLSSNAELKAKKLAQQLAQKEGELAKFSTMMSDLNSSRHCVTELRSKLEKSQQTVIEQKVELDENKKQAKRANEFAQKIELKDREILQLQCVADEFELSQMEIEKLNNHIHKLAANEKTIAQNDIEIRRLKSEAIALRRQRNTATQKGEALQRKIDQQSKAIDYTLQLELRLRQLEPMEKELKLRDARIVELSQRLKATQKNTLIRTSRGGVSSVEQQFEPVD